MEYRRVSPPVTSEPAGVDWSSVSSAWVPSTTTSAHPTTTQLPLGYPAPPPNLSPRQRDRWYRQQQKSLRNQQKFILKQQKRYARARVYAVMGSVLFVAVLVVLAVVVGSQFLSGDIGVGSVPSIPSP